MVFARGDIAVDDVRFGRKTELRDRVLFVDEKGLSDFNYRCSSESSLT